MARGKKTEEAYAAPPEVTVTEVPGVIRGPAAARKSHPSVQQLALRDYAANLGMMFSQTPNTGADELAALKEFFSWGDEPWEIIGRGETRSWDDVNRKARAVFNDLEDMEHFKEWKESCPLLQGPTAFTFVQLQSAFSMELHRSSRWEALQALAQVVVPGLKSKAS